MDRFQGNLSFVIAVMAATLTVLLYTTSPQAESYNSSGCGQF